MVSRRRRIRVVSGDVLCFPYVHGVQRRPDPAGVGGGARGELVGGRVHPARDVVDAAHDVGGQRGHAAAHRLGRLQEAREVAHGGRGAVGLAHHVVQRRRRAAVQLALPVVQNRAPDAATNTMVTPSIHDYTAGATID